MVDEEGERTGADGAAPSARMDNRRITGNSSKTREYLGPCDVYETSPKTSKKRTCPPSPKPGQFTHASDGIYLPKLAESSLENDDDDDNDDNGEVTCYKNGTPENISTKKRHGTKGSKSQVSSPKNKIKSQGVSKGRHKDNGEHSKVVRTVEHPPTPPEEQSRISSPENSSGVQIVIDEGSEVNSCCSQEGDEMKAFERDSYLSVEAAYENDRRASATSQIYLLSELR